MATNSPKQGKKTPQLEKCLATLRTLQDDLQKRGVLHASIFGSVARKQADNSSDIDIIVEIEDGRGFGLVKLVGLKRELTQMFGRPVDVVSTGGLKSPKHDNIRKEMRKAF